MVSPWSLWWSSSAFSNELGKMALKWSGPRDGEGVARDGKCGEVVATMLAGCTRSGIEVAAMFEKLWVLNLFDGFCLKIQMFPYCIQNLFWI